MKEEYAWKPGTIVGLDEAGRGPLAGPVYAAAVILPVGFPVELLNDSKKLSEKRREEAAAIIMKDATWGIAAAEASEIDRINILQASLLAMTRAWEALRAAFPRILQKSEKDKNDHIDAAENITAVVEGLTAIVDGLYCPKLPIPCQALIKADSKVPEVMAASILAKTARDRMMIRYSWFYPEYGYEKHKGYPTKAHREAIARYGPSPIQRTSFTVKEL
jgi:ribonuclease HII